MTCCPNRRRGLCDSICVTPFLSLPLCQQNCPSADMQNPNQKSFKASRLTTTQIIDAIAADIGLLRPVAFQSCRNLLYWEKRRCAHPAWKLCWRAALRGGPPRQCGGPAARGPPLLSRRCSLPPPATAAQRPLVQKGIACAGLGFAH
jgi:hypothetical protein